MNDQTLPPERRARGGKFLPALCNLLGTLMLLAAIAACLPVTAPRLLGYDIYDVVSASMAPEIPVGSIIYVKYAPPETIAPGEVIAFFSNGGVVCHRVVENRTAEGELTTKGDANTVEDLSAVPYYEVVGRVEHHLPALGVLMELFTSLAGKVFLLALAACGATLNLLGSRLRSRALDDEE